MRGRRSKSRRILIVEDDRSLAHMYRATLRFEGFDVDTAFDGESALRQIDQHRPDLIVLDLHLPRLGGEAIVDEIAATPALRRTPVVVVTGSDANIAVEQAAALLRKPCEPDRLLSVIERHFASAA